MTLSVLSPCLQCGDMLSGIQCGPQQRALCTKFLDYIQKLHRARLSRIMIKELKQLISN